VRGASPWARATPPHKGQLPPLPVKDEYIGNDHSGVSAAQPTLGHNWLDIKRYALGIAREVTPDFLILCGPKRRYEDLGVPVIEDSVGAVGPIGGLYAAADAIRQSE